jgi:hypothetical protein
MNEQVIGYNFEPEGGNTGMRWLQNIQARNGTLPMCVASI